MICLLTGCSVFNKDKSPKQVELNPSPINTNAVDSAAIPSDYSASHTDRLTDTIPTPDKPKLPLEYMTIEEKAMVEEINLFRGDPNAYIQYVDAYLQDFLNDDNFDFASKQNERYAVEELIRILRYQAPLPMLAYDESLYNVAKMHGEDMKSQDFVGHRGTDGLSPVQRIQDSTALTGSENLVGGARSVRESIIMLLVDANDRAGRAHRKALMSQSWEYVACYSAGTINGTANTWVQLFALNDPNDVPKEEPIRTVPEDTTDSPDTVNNEEGNTTPAMAGDFSYMSEEERKMINEINLMRSNPKAYVKYVDVYVAEQKTMRLGGTQVLDEFANSLKNDLRKSPKLSTLIPDPKLYAQTKAHGLDNKKHNQLEHKGTDGRSSYDRVTAAGFQNSFDAQGNGAPNENLAGGEKTIRNTVLALLIDEGLMSKGHRRALLEPTFGYVVCYKIGTIENLKDLGGTEDMGHCWVQLFAKADEKSKNAAEGKPSLKNTPPAKPTSAKPNTPTSSTSTTSADGDFSFMTTEEKAMIDEINLMRSNPKGYIKFIDAYVTEMKKVMMGGTQSMEEAANELKDQFNNMSALSILQPNSKLYDVTKAHGLDNKRHNQLEHTGSDGRQSFDRVKQAGLKNSISPNGVYAPNENLVGGENTVRNAVIALLIDDGISTRGHRKALIEPTWQYVACYKIGTIKNLKDFGGTEDMDNCWVQFFAIQ